MSEPTTKGLTRRALLSRAVAVGALAVAGAGFIAAPDAAWAVEVIAISEHEMATLLQMARDIYPHDRVGDRFYAIAIKGYDTAENQPMVAEGIAALDAAAPGWVARYEALDSALDMGPAPARALRRVEERTSIRASRSSRSGTPRGSSRRRRPG